MHKISLKIFLINSLIRNKGDTEKIKLNILVLLSFFIIKTNQVKNLFPKYIPIQ